MPWDRVHDEAEVLEHHISEELEELIAAKLGEPALDPHGDPIPDRDLAIGDGRLGRAHRARRLGTSGRLHPRLRQRRLDAALPRRARRSSRGPGWRSQGREPFGGPVMVEVGGRTHPLGPELAGSMRVAVDARAGHERAGDHRPVRTTSAICRARTRELSPPPTTGNGLGGVEDVLPGEAAVAARGAALARRAIPRGLPRIWPFLGPAFIAAVAYIDPGNFATNIAGGAKFGYLLLWVVLAANLIAMVVQTQSAKLGIATGKNLAEACRGLVLPAHLDRPLDPGRDRRDGLRHRRGRRRRARPQPALRHPALPGGPDRRRRRLRDPRPAADGLPPAGGRRSSRWSASSCSPSSSSSSTRSRTAARSPSTSSSPASPAPRASCSPPGSSARP